MATKQDQQRAQKQPQQTGKRDKQSSGSQKQGPNMGPQETADEDRNNDAESSPRDAKGRFRSGE